MTASLPTYNIPHSSTDTYNCHSSAQMHVQMLMHYGNINIFDNLSIQFSVVSKQLHCDIIASEQIDWVINMYQKHYNTNNVTCIRLINSERNI